MKIDEAINILKQYIDYNNPDVPDFYTMEEACEVVIKALEQEHCDDCIRRSDMLDAVGHGTTYTSEEVQDIIDGMPSVTPQPKIGHWEWAQYDGNPNIGNWHCSECRTIIPHMPEETDNTPIYKWCPMCGCKMREVEG